MTVAIIIPARYESSRFPGKPLALILGKPMIEWVIDTVSKSKLANKIIVATDDKRIHDTARLKNIEVCLTSKDHKSGTDRICEVVKKNPEIKYIVNLQGDEPLMPPEYIDKVIEKLLTSQNSTLSIVSLASPITTKEELNNPSVVKVSIDKNGFAISFFRLPNNSNLRTYYRHIGIYGYARETLLKFNSLPQSALEIKEQLEQIRALENNIKIKLEIVPKAYPAVDVKEDIEAVESMLM